MNAPRSFRRDASGASAAEFALILPVFLLFLLGMIDVGRFVWSFNELEKATQTGTRWAVATDIIPKDLIIYSFASQGGITQGTVVPKSAFPGVHCVGASDTTVTCTCRSGGNCAFSVTGDNATFSALLGRMRQIYPSLLGTNLNVDYDWSGIGFSGDPNGPDVAPIVSVYAQNLSFPLLFMLGTSIDMPTSRYTMTLEDGQGTVSN